MNKSCEDCGGKYKHYRGCSKENRKRFFISGSTLYSGFIAFVVFVILSLVVGLVNERLTNGAYVHWSTIYLEFMVFFVAVSIFNLLKEEFQKKRR